MDLHIEAGVWVGRGRLPTQDCLPSAAPEVRTQWRWHAAPPRLVQCAPWPPHEISDSPLPRGSAPPGYLEKYQIPPPSLGAVHPLTGLTKHQHGGD